jgi:hypothetical protein
MALIATPKAANANAYITAATADTLLAQRLNVAEWGTASTPTKESALIWATRLLDVSFMWAGTRRTLAQSLRWPRAGILDIDGYWLDYDTIPLTLQYATAELALALVKRPNRTAEPDILGQGLSEIKVGPIDLTIDPRKVLAMIPPDIALELKPYGDLQAAASGKMGQVKLLRT